jgi:hypothetical protein
MPVEPDNGIGSSMSSSIAISEPAADNMMKFNESMDTAGGAYDAETGAVSAAGNYASELYKIYYPSYYYVYSNC